MAGSCGDCGMCCSLIGVEALAKPRGQWCRHFERGTGCTIYDARPQDCRHFTCAFLTVDGLPDDWRPDRAGFLMWSDGDNRLMVEVDAARPFSWKREPFYSRIKAWSARVEGGPSVVIVRAMGRVSVVFPETDIDLGPEQARQISSGYLDRGGHRVAFAEYV